MQADEAVTEEVRLDPPLDVAQPPYRRWAAFFGGAAVALLVVMAVPGLRDVLKPPDEWFWEVAVNNEYPLLVAAAEALALIGGAFAMAILTVVGAVVLAWQRRWPAFAMWIVVITVATVMNAVIKAIYERPRPPLPLTEEHSWSFASGHAMTAAVMALMVVTVWVPAGSRRRALLVVGAAYALVMAASRVYLRVHWFTDVSAGLAIGAATGLALLLLARWWFARPLD